MLTGCMTFDLFDAKPDSALTTNSLPAKKNPDAISDEATVRNAVTSADLSKIDNTSLPWANASTGSAGVITAIRENRTDQTVCRAFTTSRHAYDGIANFTGEACLGAGDEWVLTSFTRQD